MNFDSWSNRALNALTNELVPKPMASFAVPIAITRPDIELIVPMVEPKY